VRDELRLPPGALEWDHRRPRDLGFGLWELAFVALAGGVVSYLGLRSYRWIGAAWLMHSFWDVLHHFYGRPIWSFAPRSSWGCMIFDAVIAIWFLAGAPALVRPEHSRRAEASSPRDRHRRSS